MIDIKSLINLFRKKPRCTHLLNRTDHKYIGVDGTPMITTICDDCGYCDHGHVYANDWPRDEVSIVRNGKKVI